MSLLLRVIGTAVAAGLAGVAAAAVFVPTPEAESIEARRGSGATAAFAPLPAVNVQASNLILDMSPFAKDRSAFDRTTASAPPPRRSQGHCRDWWSGTLQPRPGFRISPVWLSASDPGIVLAVALPLALVPGLRLFPAVPIPGLRP